MLIDIHPSRCNYILLGYRKIKALSSSTFVAHVNLTSATFFRLFCVGVSSLVMFLALIISLVSVCIYTYSIAYVQRVEMCQNW